MLSTAAQLEKKGFRTSVIYGALPPQARRDEVRKYMEGESNVVVATDAIGLGISLPIARIIFAETSKFDGKKIRQLNVAEVKQIAGRAGRYGLNEYGEVLNFGDHSFVGSYLNAQSRTVKGCCIAFPREILQTEYPLEKLLRIWQNLKRSKLFIREDMQDALILLGTVKKLVRKNNRELVFDLITCPVDTSSQELVGYWTQCASAIIKNKEAPLPYFGVGSLQACELQAVFRRRKSAGLRAAVQGLGYPSSAAAAHRPGRGLYERARGDLPDDRKIHGAEQGPVSSPLQTLRKSPGDRLHFRPLRELL